MTDRRVSIALFVLTFVAYAWFFNGGGWNQNAQFDLARALVERQTLHIDGYRVNTGDISWSAVSGEWHAYINKPPGVSFLAAIPYAPLYAIERALHVPVDTWFWITVNAWIVTMLTCGVTGALIPVVVYRYGRRNGAAPSAAAAAALAMAFGTIAFPFATMLFAHVPAAFFLVLAFVWLDERPLLAGVSAAIASVCFYICIPAAAVLFIGAWVRSRRNAIRFALGGLPFGILLGIYHQLCFGSPFVTSVETSTDFTEKGLLFGVFRLPSLEALWGLTFSEYRGLFFVSPVLLLAFAGMRRMSRRDVVMILAIAAIFLFAIASFNGWSGGGSFGPRYLLPIIPLLALPLSFVPRRALVLLGIPLAIVSFAMQLLATTVDPMPHAGIRQPVQAHLAELIAGNTSTNMQAIDELVPHHHYKHGSHESTWASFNVGELLVGPSNPVSVIPIVLWVLAGSALLLRRARGAVGS
jgi:hypothetical protein